MTRTKTLYVHTIGCQMNVYDSGWIIRSLRPLGYTVAPVPELADLVVVNTCSIRRKAEEKAFSLLGRLLELKKKNPALIIAVGGCVAQQEGEKILRRAPHVNIVFGTRAIGRLPALVKRAAQGSRRIVDVAVTGEIESGDSAGSNSTAENPCAFVTVMRGCDNFCAYCVVPHVRGREQSRHPDGILREIRTLVDSGVREVTLLGQNVNSYGLKEGLCSFSELLHRIHEIEGLCRIRFTTSHPKDLSGHLMEAFGSLKKLCRHIHLPVQSGSDRILERMNRRYTRQVYLEKVERIREHCQDIAITSDFIVGFPGETPRDFEETLLLVEKVRYEGLFVFKYSDRPGAASVGFSDKVAENIKQERLKRLLAIQDGITAEKNAALVGSVEPVLVDGWSKKQAGNRTGGAHGEVQWTGRTSSNKVVNFVPGNGRSVSPGMMLNVRIEKAYTHSLWGMPATPPLDMKGEESCCTR